jgi:APA family basic amino acid/polyamine antiporter
MDPGITAAIAAGLASYVGYALGISGISLRLIAIGSIVVLGAVNVVGLRIGSWVMQALTVLKVGALALIAVLAFSVGAGSWAHFSPFVAQHPGSDPLPGAFAPALVGAFFAFGGWWEISKLAGEARDPARTLPRALALGVGIVTAIYILITAVFLYLVPLERVTSGETFAAQAGELLFGPSGGQVFAWIVVIAVLGSLLGLLMALPRVYYAMARDGVFFPSVAAIHPRFRTPARAIAIQSVLASILVASGTFNQIIAYFIFITVLFVGLTVAGLFRIRRRSAAASYRTWGYPVTPIIFLLLVALLLLLLAGHNPAQAALGVLIVGLGIPVYLRFFRRV